MDEKKIHVWITKYALTQGIFESDATVCSEADKTGDMIAVHTSGYCDQYFHGNGKDWTETIEEAVKIAEKMRDKKVASLGKQINKLQVMKFAHDVGE